MSKGRGRLSSIDLLPREADADVQWAAAELLEGKRTQADILAEFNKRLATNGCGPISPSSFGRHSIWLAETTRELSEARELAKAVTERLGADDADDITIMMIELIKASGARMIRHHGSEMGPKDLLALSKSLQAALSAQKLSADQRRLGEAELKAKAEKATEAAADGIVAATPGANKAEVLKRIREDVYGIFKK